MRRILAVVLFMVAFIFNFNSSNAQQQLNLFTIDSLINSDSLRLFDLSYPYEVNSSVSVVKRIKLLDAFNRKYTLVKCYDEQDNLVKEKVIYSKGNALNFQVFYRGFKYFKIGILYPCKGDKSDEEYAPGIPYSTLPATAIMVRCQTSTEKYLISFDYIDTLFGYFSISKFVRVAILPLNERLSAKYIYVGCPPVGLYSLYSIEDLNKTVLDKVDQFKFTHDHLPEVLDEGIGTNYRPASVLRQYSIYRWYDLLSCNTNR